MSPEGSLAPRRGAGEFLRGLTAFTGVSRRRETLGFLPSSLAGSWLAVRACGAGFDTSKGVGIFVSVRGPVSAAGITLRSRNTAIFALPGVLLAFTPSTLLFPAPCASFRDRWKRRGSAITRGNRATPGAPVLFAGGTAPTSSCLIVTCCVSGGTAG